VGDGKAAAFDVHLGCLAALGLRSLFKAASEERLRRSGRVSLALLDFLVLGEGQVLVEGLPAVPGLVLGSLRVEPSPELAGPAMAVLAVDDGPLSFPGAGSRF
jgi:hypothetical protein